MEGSLTISTVMTTNQGQPYPEAVENVEIVLLENGRSTCAVKIGREIEEQTR